MGRTERNLRAILDKIAIVWYTKENRFDYHTPRSLDTIAIRIIDILMTEFRYTPQIKAPALSNGSPAFYLHSVVCGKAFIYIVLFVESDVTKLKSDFSHIYGDFLHKHH